MFINFKELGNSGGGSGSGVTPQQVQQQIDSALTPYWDSAATEDAISAATSGKADAASVTARNSDIPSNGPVYIPKWNEEGIITGDGSTFYRQAFYVNGVAQTKIYKHNSNTIPPIYAPVSAGTAGDILVSTGSGAPVWSAFTGGDMSGYWTSAETQSAITEAYDSATTHIDEVEQIMSSALNEFHTQIIDLSGETQGLKSNFGFISGRVQTNEEVLALAVNNIEGIKGDLSAYTPTSGFSTINGSAITNGGNLVVETDLSNYTPTTGFATVNGSAVTNGGNIVIPSGSTYTLPVATEQTLGGVKVHNLGIYPIYLDPTDTLALDMNQVRNRLGEVDQSKMSKILYPVGKYNIIDDVLPGDVSNIIIPPYSGIATFKASDLVNELGDSTDSEIFGMTWTDSEDAMWGNPHLHLYYNKEEDQDPYFTFDDLEETGDMPRFDLVDGTSAFTFVVEESAFTYTANVTVANGDDISVVVTIHNEDEDRDMWVGSWTDSAMVSINWPTSSNLVKITKMYEDPEIGDIVLKYSKYYNEDNINEVTDNLVKNEGGVSGIWKGTQAQYDTLTQSGATANPNTFYIIIPSA